MISFDGVYALIWQLHRCRSLCDQEAVADARDVGWFCLEERVEFEIIRVVSELVVDGLDRRRVLLQVTDKRPVPTVGCFDQHVQQPGGTSAMVRRGKEVDCIKSPAQLVKAWVQVC